MNLLLVTIPALVGAFGTVVSVYVAATMQTVKRQTNGAMAALERRVQELELQATHARRSAKHVRSHQ